MKCPSYKLTCKMMSMPKNMITMNEGDVFYLTSDGYYDQPDPSRRSYGSQHLRAFLKEICHLNMEKQKIALINELENYQSGAPQRDDITLVGIRCP